MLSGHSLESLLSQLNKGMPAPVRIYLDHFPDGVTARIKLLLQNTPIELIDNADLAINVKDIKVFSYINEDLRALSEDNIRNRLGRILLNSKSTYCAILPNNIPSFYVPLWAYDLGLAKLKNVPTNEMQLAEHVLLIILQVVAKNGPFDIARTVSASCKQISSQPKTAYLSYDVSDWEHLNYARIIKEKLEQRGFKVTSSSEMLASKYPHYCANKILHAAHVCVLGNEKFALDNENGFRDFELSMISKRAIGKTLAYASNPNVKRNFPSLMRIPISQNRMPFFLLDPAIPQNIPVEPTEALNKTQKAVIRQFFKPLFLKLEKLDASDALRILQAVQADNLSDATLAFLQKTQTRKLVEAARHIFTHQNPHHRNQGDPQAYRQWMNTYAEMPQVYQQWMNEKAELPPQEVILKTPINYGQRVPCEEGLKTGVSDGLVYYFGKNGKPKFEDQGILNLTPLNDTTSATVTKFSTIHFIQALIEKQALKMTLQAEQHRGLTSKFSFFTGMPADISDEALAENDFSITKRYV